MNFDSILYDVSINFDGGLSEIMKIAADPPRVMLLSEEDK